LTTRYVRASEGSKPMIAARLRELAETDPPLAGCPDTHWIERKQGIFLVMPLAQDRPNYGLTFGLELEGLSTINKTDCEVGKGGAKSRLLEGMTLSNRDLLHAAMLGSDNRAVPRSGARCADALQWRR
jgi:hypothetical protein